MFSELSHVDMIKDVPYSCGPDSFVQPGINAHIWSPHLFHGKLLDLLKCQRSLRLEAHPKNVPVNVDGILWCHHLVDGRMALLVALFVGAILYGPNSKSSKIIFKWSFQRVQNTLHKETKMTPTL